MLFEPLTAVAWTSDSRSPRAEDMIKKEFDWKPKSGGGTRGQKSALPMTKISIGNVLPDRNCFAHQDTTLQQFFSPQTFQVFSGTIPRRPSRPAFLPIATGLLLGISLLLEGSWCFFVLQIWCWAEAKGAEAQVEHLFCWPFGTLQYFPTLRPPSLKPLSL